MAWTEITRRHYRRENMRDASDLTGAEWQLVEPFMPAASAIGRPRTTDLRAVVDAILYIASTGCQWVYVSVEPGKAAPSNDKVPKRENHYHARADYIFHTFAG